MCAKEWGKRPLEDVYPIVFLDCMVLKIREGGTVGRRALYRRDWAVTLDGDRDVLGMWFQEAEGAKFWMQVLTDLKTRGVRDILICCDGLAGFPEAIEAIFPKTTVQTCIVHLIRSSLKYVPRREREQVARPETDLHRRQRRTGPGLEPRRSTRRGVRFPVITQAWLSAWEHVIPFLGFPAEVRRVIYTTNAIEALNRQLRKAIKTKGSFPRTPPASSSTSRCRTRSATGTRTRNWDDGAARVQDPLRCPRP